MTKMTNKQKIIILIAVLLIAVQLVFFLPSSVDEWSNQATQSSNQPEQIMTDVKLFERRGDNHDWELEANRAEALSHKKDWLLYDVRIKFYGTDMDYIVTAENASVEGESSNMAISGNIEVLTSSGFKFYTQKMDYIADENKLSAPTATKIISPKDKTGSFVEMQSMSMVANIELNQAMAIGNVEAIKYEVHRQVKIQSNEAVFHLDTKAAQFVNNVKVFYDTSIAESPLASLVYDPAKDTFTELQLSGGAKLTDQNRLALSEEMVVDFTKNQLKLSGKPRLIQDGDELIGEVIYLLNGGKRIKVEGAKAQIEDTKGLRQ